MWEIDEGYLMRYRCHVGHAHTAEMMSLALDDNLRRAVGSALRPIEERIAPAEKLTMESRDSGRRSLAENWTRRLRDFEAEADLIRTTIRRLDEMATRFAQQ